MRRGDGRHDPVPAQHHRTGLADPDFARFAWSRYLRLMRWMVLAAVVAVTGAITWLSADGGPVPVHMLVATIAGVFFSVLLAAALMGLVFLSSGAGHDEDGAEGDDGGGR